MSMTLTLQPPLQDADLNAAAAAQHGKPFLQRRQSITFMDTEGKEATSRAAMSTPSEAVLAAAKAAMPQSVIATPTTASSQPESPWTIATGPADADLEQKPWGSTYAIPVGQRPPPLDLLQHFNSTVRDRELTEARERVSRVKGEVASNEATPLLQRTQEAEEVKGEEKKVPRPFLSRQEVLSGTAYCIMSALMTILNKSVLSGHAFGSPSTLVAFQNCVSLALVMLCRHVGIARPAPVTTPLLIDWAPVSVLFVGMLYTGILGLKYLGVPTMSVMKNINNFMIIIGEYMLYGKVYRLTVWATIVLIFVSAYCSAVTDLAFNVQGLVWQLLNCAFTAAYTLHLRSQLVALKKKMGGSMDTYTSLLYKTLLAIPLLIAVSSVTGELDGVMDDPALSRGNFWVTAWAGAIGSFMISVCATWFITNTSATSFGIVSALSKVPPCVFSILFMGQPTSARNLLSVGFGIAAGALFVWEKQRTMPKPPAAAAPKA